MIRKLRSAALLLTAPAALSIAFAAVGPASAAALPATAHVEAACTTTGPIEVNGFAFTPPQVFAGQSSTADLITTNCTNSTLIVTQEWTGQWLPLTGTYPPAGCPIIDPFIRSVVYAPGQELAENTTYTVPATCQAAELAVTVHISTSAGGPEIAATAYLRILHVAP